MSPSSRFLQISTLIILLLNGCGPASIQPLRTGISSQPTNTFETNMLLSTNEPHNVTEVEKLAEFDVKVPTYLPPGVSLDYASYQKSPYPEVTLHFKIVHETYGDMGAFFQIVQILQADSSSNTIVCSVSDTNCEILQIGDVFVVYRLTSPTESIMWNMDGFSFNLLRTAGEPNKIYKDELLKVVESIIQLPADATTLSQASDIALSILRKSFVYGEPLKFVEEGEMSYGEFGNLVNETIDHPADMRVWVAIYYSKMWQFTPLSSPSSTPTPPFRGCVFVVINLADGSPVEVGGPLSKNTLLECDN